MLVPAVTSLIYGEMQSFFAFVITALCTGAVFLPICIGTRHCEQRLYISEAFAVVALCWVVWSVVGSVPFYLTGDITDFSNGFLEAVSAFTTTGATVFSDVESLSHGILLWRSLMHWVGGMGVLVFALAIVPVTQSGSYMNLFRAEMTGSEVGKLVPKAKQTAYILYGIYAAMTAVLVILLLLGGMPLFDSINHAMSTAGTGGMSVRNSSIASYGSAYIEWVITVFMLLFGVNFTLYYLILRGRVREALKSSELKCFLSIYLIATAVITVTLLANGNGNFADDLRHSAFTAASIMSTTGFYNNNFNLWPHFAKFILLLLMIVGSCAGSTAGGIKVSRAQIAAKTVYRDVKRQVSPRFVYNIRSEGKTVDNYTVNGVTAFLLCYFVIAASATVVVMLDPAGLDIESSISAAITSLGNVGPGLARVGPVENFAFLSPITKIVLSVCMLLGRLEIFPFFILFSKRMFTRRSF